MAATHINPVSTAGSQFRLADQPIAKAEKRTTHGGSGCDLPSLLKSARQGNRQSIGQLLQQYRNYLTLLAITQIEKRLQPVVSPSDVVQETMLRAHRNFAQFNGQSERELLAWLRQILISNLSRFVEQYMLAAKRDIRREVSFEQLRPSSAGACVRFDPILQTSGESPSAAAQRHEEALVLAERLAKLPSLYREVLVLRHVHGNSFEVVAARMNRSLGATRMLWLRALEKLRTAYRRAEGYGL